MTDEKQGDGEAEEIDLDSLSEALSDYWRRKRKREAEKRTTKDDPDFIRRCPKTSK